MKRIVDIIGSVALLIVLSPVFIMVWIVVYLKLGWPVFFRQDRPGLHGLPFTLIKFRTMSVDDADSPASTSFDAERLSSLGQWLRSTSLDELPELLNVLKGEMSLVGPRPLLMEYLPLYDEEQKRRHHVRPGLTGWAQVNGRNALTWEEKFELDIWYVDNRSMLLDAKILLMSVIKVLKREGIHTEGEATTRKYTGSWPKGPGQ